MAASRALELVDPDRHPRAYVRHAVRRSFMRLLRTATTQSRCPHDAWGRPIRHAISIDDVRPSSTDDVETHVGNREVVAYLSERLDPRDWQELIAAFVEGSESARQRASLKQARARARSILSRLQYRVEKDTTAKSPRPLGPPPKEPRSL